MEIHVLKSFNTSNTKLVIVEKTAQLVCKTTEKTKMETDTLYQ